MEWLIAAGSALLGAAAGAAGATYGSILVNRREARLRTRVELLTELIPCALRAFEEEHDEPKAVRIAGDVERHGIVAGDREHVAALPELILEARQKTKHVETWKRKPPRTDAEEARQIEALSDLDDALQGIYDSLTAYESWLRTELPS